ncbi:MAG: glycosyl hydrolase 53 family protein [Pseudonocardia sp.]|nr:glycosyl hydrolase 53 family protein [Pseudonocardia sp.]
MMLFAATGCSRPGSDWVTAAPTPVSAPPEHLRGADLSFTLELEAAGHTFTDAGRSAPLERVLAARGADVVRLRLWVNPQPGRSDLASVLALGRRAAEAGCRILLDLHYSDTWADHSNQDTPSAWKDQSVAGLVETVRAYTRAVVDAFMRQATPPAIVQIGNEVTNGMLWPTGQVVHAVGPGGWNVFVQLLKAGIAGVRDAAPTTTETMIHIDRGGDNGGARYFYDNIVDNGVEFDLIGLSYYPFWHGSLAALSANLDDLARRYRKDVVVVETAYPWMLPSTGDGVGYFASRPDQLPDGDRFPATPAGQADYFEELRRTLAAVPDNRGRGFLVWEPAWFPGVGWEHGDVNPYANLTMFTWDGNGLPSLAAFRA